MSHPAEAGTCMAVSWCTQGLIMSTSRFSQVLSGDTGTLGRSMPMQTNAHTQADPDDQVQQLLAHVVL